MNIIIVSTTFDSKEKADSFARLVVSHKLGACCQITDAITSIYSWQSKVESATEWLCQIKTKESLYSELETFIHKHHDYDVPEIVRVDAIVSIRYFNWMNNYLT